MALLIALAVVGVLAVRVDADRADAAEQSKVVATASAHLHSEPPVPAGRTPSWPLPLVLLSALGVLRLYPRRGLAVALVLCLAVFGFAAGFHSIHHMGDGKHESACPIAAGAAHLSGVATVHIDIDPSVLVPAERVPPADHDQLRSALRFSTRGRAPPFIA
jgi:hypothetical protein